MVSSQIISSSVSLHVSGVPWGYNVIMVFHLLSVRLDKCPTHCQLSDMILWITSVTWVFCRIHSSLFRPPLVMPSIMRSIDLHLELSCDFGPDCPGFTTVCHQW
ncbi:hypothetical protein WA026_007930 [Henosepilachna vigintioctopunctata]|uniref:Uncharacterized protein n=1 Tax=Henosepilachna vigintioctopunctata TaxID=420089 RepID=A0AAW1TQM2_9CUCU